MLENRNYTKEELAKLLGIMSVRDGNIRTDILVRKLNKLGYRFSTSGRGDSYRIHIFGLPQTLATFARERLDISSNIDKLAHFLYMIFALGDDSIVNIPASSLQWKTHSCNDTLQKWIDRLVELNLLEVDDRFPIYYATHKRVYEEEIDEETSDYFYTKDFKIIGEKDYQVAMSAYNYVMEDMRGIDENPELARGEVQYHAAIHKLRAADGWWVMRANRTVTINKQHPLYTELLELLKNYTYEEYEKREKGNYLKEQEEIRKREQQWEAEKAAKKIRLEEEKIQKDAERLEAALAAASAETKKKKEMDIPDFNDFGDFLHYIHDNLLNKEGVFELYEQH